MRISRQVRILIVLLAFSLMCLQRYFKFVFDDDGLSERTINYTVFVLMMLSFDYRHFKAPLFILLLILPIGLFIRRYLPIWILLGLAYQICQLKIPIRKVALIGFIIISSELFVQYMLISHGVINDVTRKTLKASGLMHTWGMGNGNNLASFFFQAYALLYIAWGDKRWISYLILTIITGFWMYMYTCSRTPYYSLLIICACVLLLHIKAFQIRTKYLFAILVPLLFCMTLYLSLFTQGADRAEMDSITSGRISGITYYFSHMSLRSLLIGMDRPEKMALDSAYLDMLLQGGVIYALFFCIICYKAFVNSFYWIKQYIPFIIGILASGMAESTFTVLTPMSVLTWAILLNAAFPSNRPVIRKTAHKMHISLTV